MVIWQKHRGKKISGGLYRALRSKRKRELGRIPSLTRIGKANVKKIRTLGADNKLRTLRMDIVNVLNPATKTYQKAEIKKVLENKASRHFARMNVITKGALLETAVGKVRVTNRPGQDGFINAVLVE